MRGLLVEYWPWMLLGLLGGLLYVSVSSRVGYDDTFAQGLMLLGVR